MPKLKSLSSKEKSALREAVYLRACAGDLRLPEAVRDIRKSIGLTQADFAKKFGFTRAQISALEKGTANPQLETLLRLGSVFGFTVGFVPKAKAD